jgi:hypothetical protein
MLKMRLNRLKKPLKQARMVENGVQNYRFCSRNYPKALKISALNLLFQHRYRQSTNN